MLLLCQFPISDARGFLHNRGKRLLTPSWPWPEPGKHFVRGFGAVHLRPRGGHAFWADEAFFASAHQAVKYHQFEGQRLAGRNIRSAFRRLLCNGQTVVRLEIGVTLSGRLHGMDGAEFERVLHAFLDMPISVRKLQGSSVMCPLLQVGQHIAPLYENASSPSRLASLPGVPKYVVDARPIVLVENARGEVASLPKYTRRIRAEAFNEVSLSLLWHSQRGRELGVWFLQEEKRIAVQLRRLRVGLLRLHAEHQILKQVLSLYAQGAIEYVPRTSAADLLDQYLNRTTRLFAVNREAHFPCQALREELFAYDQLAGSDECQLLLQALKDVRRQVRKKIEAHLDANSACYAARNSEAQSARPAMSKSGDSLPCRACDRSSPYVFISYAHADKDIVYPELTKLSSSGFQIWYDEGLNPGTIWPKALAEAIASSSCFLAFLSARAVKSRHCLNEIHYALDQAKHFVAIYLEDVKLPGELALQINRHQAIHRHSMSSEDFQELLRRALGPVLRPLDPH